MKRALAIDRIFMMTAAISNGIVILLLILQNTYAQQGINHNVVNNAGLSQPIETCNSAGVNFNSPQPGQQINWQQTSNMQQAPASPQPGVNSKSNQNPLSDIFSTLHNLRFSVQKPQGANLLPTAGGQPAQPSNYQGPVPNNPQYVNQVPESPKPTFTFQFVPATQQNKGLENQLVLQNAIPIQYLTSGQNQMSSQQGPSYMQYQPMASQRESTAQNSQIGQPLVFTVNTQQPISSQSQPIVYTLEPSSRNNQQKTTAQGPNMSNNPMALLMSQLQSPSGNSDITSIMPMLKNTKQEKSGGMNAILPLILNLLNDRGCGCPHCGCPHNNGEPTINGGYSNQINYSQQDLPAKLSKKTPKIVSKSIEESDEVEIPKVSKRYKTNVISEENSDEDDEYEDYDE